MRRRTPDLVRASIDLPLTHGIVREELSETHRGVGIEICRFVQTKSEFFFGPSIRSRWGRATLTRAKRGVRSCSKRDFVDLAGLPEARLVEAHSVVNQRIVYHDLFRLDVPSVLQNR